MSVLNSVVKFVKYSTKPAVCYMAKHVSVTRPDAIDFAAKLINSGLVIAVPTDTLYGLACDATNLEAIVKLYGVKQRSEYKPVAICLAKISDISLWANIKHLPEGLLDELFPGPVTVILTSLEKLDQSVCRKNKIGIRIPNHSFITDLVSKVQKPLALTSANLSNQPSTVSPLQFKNIWDKIAGIFDGGITKKVLPMKPALIF
ncbi:yrdC domain-containing protein, mitochondrial [Sitophilus oryzae]|uniref:Threonylcarbamoyl-AMP synthase n=1 Tax=Sitophilus oryzae TaxID=7048 RepID=A0A6J2XZC2_SITOR|nr:yrdC domain-containing protein, mitochondrial [Sitophilus oryzae]